MPRCSATIKNGFRCSRKGLYVSKNRGIWLHVCSQHNDKTNWVNEWCDITMTRKTGTFHDTPSSLIHMLEMFNFFKRFYNWPVKYAMCVAKYVWADFIDVDFENPSSICVKNIDATFVKMYIRDKFNYTPQKTNECPLCYETHDKTIKTECGHIFCSGCIFKALHYSIKCPMCRHDILDISELK